MEGFNRDDIIWLQSLANEWTEQECRAFLVSPEAQGIQDDFLQQMLSDALASDRAKQFMLGWCGATLEMMDDGLNKVAWN